ncbi:hypothetical protein E1757_08035 [Paenibacillus piri]|uniref:Uncharacterized protein n=1 Tax=Paenibacillus piri TaxID=2547395 RepID=A0A4R5KV96_9BACL|nr:hypothetical protein E1757_08035 [Paenibacillus piri]
MLSKYLQSKEAVNYVCLTCSESEKIPLSVVRDFDRMDDGDPEVPPQFACEACGGAMYPEYYKGVHGYEYRIEDRLVKKEVAEDTRVEQ